VIHESSSPRRQRSRDRKVEGILATAMDMLLEGGIDGLTVVGLAERLELTPGALYRYFPSKDALLVALQARALEVVAKRYREERERSSKRLPSKETVAPLCELLGVARFYLALPKDEPRIFRTLSLNLAAGKNFVDDEGVAPLIAPLRQLFADLSEAFKRAAKAGALSKGDPLEHAVVYWSALHGAALVDKLDRFMASEKKGGVRGSIIGMVSARTVLAGFGASADGLSAACRWIAEEP
jgi:AcrR family transcriptional regulator